MQARVGSATTPHLQVAPLFAIHGLPKTPLEGCAPSHGLLMLGPESLSFRPLNPYCSFSCAC